MPAPQSTMPVPFPAGPALLGGQLIISSRLAQPAPQMLAGSSMKGRSTPVVCLDAEPRARSAPIEVIPTRHSGHFSEHWRLITGRKSHQAHPVSGGGVEKRAVENALGTHKAPCGILYSPE